MISLRITSTFTAIGLATAQWLDDKLLGSCADVECPSGHGACRISNQTYNIVGVDTFSFNSPSSRSENLTWSTAFHDYTAYDPDVKLERTVEKAFFLGTPESLNLTTVTGWGGCAVIMEAYNKSVDIKPSSTKKCEDVIGRDCHEELQEDTLRFARDQGNRFNSSGDACEGLKEYLQSVSGDNSKCNMNWSQVHYVPLTGSSAPKPFTEEQNSTTNCYPTIPKTNDLAFVLNWNNSGTMRFNDTVKMIASLNLALTVFWDKADAEVQESHVSCLWPVDETSTTRRTETPNGGQQHRVAGGRTQGTIWAGLGVVFALVWGVI